MSMDELSSILSSDAIKPPENDKVVIWRYMDFTKFVSLLEDQALFFCRASCFDDEFEGSFPTQQPSKERILELLPAGVRKNAKQINYYSKITETWRFMREWALINSWHANPVESAAMWRLYSKSEYAVGIRSTVGRLKEALDSPPTAPKGFHDGDQFHIGMVDYIDYQKDRIPVNNLYNPFFRKRKSFEHEREVRTVFLQYPLTEDRKIDHNQQPKDNGRLFPVNLEVLLVCVYVAPRAPAWYAKLVQKVTKRYGLNVPVNQSSLDAEPMY